MKIIFNRPQIGVTTKEITIERDGEKIGEMARWFHSQEERILGNPIDNINIKVSSREENYKIEKESAALDRGDRWSIYKDELVIAEMAMEKRIKKKHRIHVKLDQSSELSIQATWKGNGVITINDKQVGETKSTGFLFHSKIVMETENLDSVIAPTLFAGITYVFWLSSRF
ncbi:tubby C-terminal domain-like protein [Radiobacillus deserti]|uniref:Tubby C-terminal domain-containing protein n=1 Tax=Radiobacillus deserti TaxID=2594883 RepID=A0A516KJI0_9BACI|nr:hypothetical protein [Radiobacillus deserti]QDP41554.1 hypothetical protein FN924_16055 [Radiobacillus deserti]